MHDLKNTFNYKDLRLRGTHWYIKYLTFTIVKAVLILNFYQLSSIDTNLFKTLIEKRFQYSSEKHFERGEWQYENFHRITHKTIFWTFWLHKNIFITLQYSGNILGIFLKQKFVECSSNILETLLCDYWNLPKDQHLSSSNHTLLTKNNFSIENFFKNIFL